MDNAKLGGMIAVANIRGSMYAPNLSGKVYFIRAPGGTRVIVNISGLPAYKPAEGENGQPVGPFGFHLHEKSCELGDLRNPYAECGGHYNPDNQPHGNHAGDFPVLFSNDGKAEMSFYTNRFSVDEIVGRSVIIHQNPDDYRTQPSGNSGKRIGQGNIEWLR